MNLVINHGRSESVILVGDLIEMERKVLLDNGITPEGNCYLLSALLARGLSKLGIKVDVCHGKIIDDEGIPLVHAWLEYKDMVIDGTQKEPKCRVLPKRMIYEKTKPLFVRTYSYKDYLSNTRKFNHEGPFHPSLVKIQVDLERRGLVKGPENKGVANGARV